MLTSGVTRSSLGAACPSKTGIATAGLSVRRPCASSSLPRASSRCNDSSAHSPSSSSAQPSMEISKRELLTSLGLACALGMASPANAAGPKVTEAVGEYATFFGFATPPTSYGGYGGNADEPPKYTFEYPSAWKEEKPSKVEKGTQGVDGRVVNPKAKDQRAFLITLSRAGEDNATFKVRDLESTFAGFAGADYVLQDAIQSATNTTNSTRELDGLTVYDFDIESPVYRYLSSVTFKDGKVFALFIRSPTKTFTQNEDKLRHIQSSFKLL